jgi:hypothetical protein
MLDKIIMPRTETAIRSFLGFVGFYRVFIPNFSELASPLMKLTKKEFNEPIPITEVHEQAFEGLKTAFRRAPILRVADVNRLFIVQSDASDIAMGAVLAQYGDEQMLQPITFVSKNFSSLRKTTPS